jgi:hypothetical protein
MINGNEVMDPCPISVAGDMRVIVPSSAMLTQGLSAFSPLPFASESALGADRYRESEPDSAGHDLSA